MTLHDIENAIAGLSADELSQFRVWFASFDSEAWDLQIEHDIHAGELDNLADAALRVHQEGKTL
ncbi:MAG: hypothetical protein MI725_17535 [Pirellulales bacterium]|nr:hypothetical protein [Pirellulales bacterium]